MANRPIIQLRRQPLIDAVAKLDQATAMTSVTNVPSALTDCMTEARDILQAELNRVRGVDSTPSGGRA